MVLDFGARTRQLHRDYGNVFATPAGERVFSDLMQFSGFGREVFTQGETHEPFIRLGMQRLILRISHFRFMSERVLIERAVRENEAVNE